MNVNIKRTMKNLKKVGEIGKCDETGITRTAFSEKYFESVEVLKELMAKANLEVTVDSMGNVFGRRKGTDDSLPAIMIGSHLDTVINGGLYDGLLGIIAGLEVVDMLNENDVTTKHPIEIAAFNCEEGNELGGTFGSRVVTGRQNLEEEGLGEKIARYDLSFEDLKKSIRDMDDIYAYLELHVEQGPFLDHKNIDIGVVSGIVGINRYKITIKGEPNHAGTTPMDLRKDPVLVAAKIVQKVNKLAKAYEHPFVATVGNIVVEPGMYNVIGDNVVLYLDVRDLNQDNADKFVTDLQDYYKKFTDFEIGWAMNIQKPAMLMTEEMTKKIYEISTKKDYTTTYLASGAGHDAKEFIYKVPSAMIFVPSKDGISHSPLEYTPEENIAIGIDVLYDTVIELDK